MRLGSSMFWPCWAAHWRADAAGATTKLAPAASPSGNQPARASSAKSRAERSGEERRSRGVARRCGVGTAVPDRAMSTWWERTLQLDLHADHPVPPPWRIPSAVWCAASPMAPAKAADASAISPVCHCQTPQGMDHHDTPKTRSTGSQPIECSSRVSSMDRSEVAPRGWLSAGWSWRRRDGHLRLGDSRRLIRSRTTGSGSSSGAKSLKRRTRVPLIRHWIARSPSPISRSPGRQGRAVEEVAVQLAPCVLAGEVTGRAAAHG